MKTKNIKQTQMDYESKKFLIEMLNMRMYFSVSSFAVSAIQRLSELK